MLTPQRRALLEASYSALMIRGAPTAPPSRPSPDPADHPNQHPDSDLRCQPGRRPG